MENTRIVVVDEKTRHIVAAELASIAFNFTKAATPANAHYTQEKLEEAILNQYTRFYQLLTPGKAQNEV